MKLWLSVLIVSYMLLAAGCTSLTIERTEIAGRTYTYVLGKIANAGQEGVLRDAYDENGKLIVSHFGSGQSLAGAALNGAVAGAAIGVGTGVGLSNMRPARSTETTNVHNEADSGGQLQVQGQVTEQTQGQLQGQHQGQSSYNSNSSNSKSSAGAIAGATSSSTSTNRNTNTNTNTGGRHGGHHED